MYDPYLSPWFTSNAGLTLAIVVCWSVWGFGTTFRAAATLATWFHLFLCFIIYFIFIIFALDTFLQKKSFLLSEWLFIDETQTPRRSTILLHYKHLCCFLLDCSNNMVIIWQRIYFVLISSDWLFFQWLFCLICRRIWQLTYRAYEVFLRQKREVMTLYNMNPRPTNASLYSKIGKNISKLTLPLSYYLKCAITSMDK